MDNQETVLGGGGQTFFSSWKYPDQQLWGPPSFQFSG